MQNELKPAGFKSSDFYDPKHPLTKFRHSFRMMESIHENYGALTLDSIRQSLDVVASPPARQSLKIFLAFALAPKSTFAPN